MPTVGPMERHRYRQWIEWTPLYSYYTSVYLAVLVNSSQNSDVSETFKSTRLEKGKVQKRSKITEKHKSSSEELKISCVRHGFMIPESCGLRICLFGKL